LIGGSRSIISTRRRAYDKLERRYAEGYLPSGGSAGSSSQMITPTGEN
jgi:hypothetical protein